MTEYHHKESCNKCCGTNNIVVTDFTDSFVSECETICSECGHKDYWAHGFFESGTEMKSNCRKYYVDNTIL